MPDDSEVGIVLANAPRLERAFGRKLAAVITLISLYFARRQPGPLGLLASLLLVAALTLRVWTKLCG